MLRNTLVNLAAVIALSVLLIGLAVAATPESGAITNEQPTVEFSGGPYVFPNVTNLLQLADESTVCVEGTETCDVFRFEVNLSDFNPDEDLVTITVEWPDGIPEPSGTQSMPDYDLELWDDTTGTFITQQATGDNPEIMVLPVQNGKYQLRIIPYLGTMDAPYTGKIAFLKFEEDKSGPLGFVGALDPAALGGLALLALAGLSRRRSA